MPTINSKDKAALLDTAKQKLWNTAVDCAWTLLDKAPLSWNSSDARFYRTEQRLLRQHVMDPFFGGLGVGMFLFATLRITGSAWFARFVQQSSWRSSVASTMPRREAANGGRRPEWKSHLEKETEKHEAYAKEAFKLPSDAFVSVLCGVSSMLWLSRPNDLCKDVVEAPLLPGKSVVYEFVCPAMETTFEQEVTASSLMQDYPPAKEDATLKMFGMLLYNCRQRSKYLEALDESKEQAGRPTGVVPYPGLEGKRVRLKEGWAQ